MDIGNEGPQGFPLSLVSVALTEATSGSVLLNFCCGAGNFGKIWSARGKHEIYCMK
jgi:predicted RNA methylase